MDNHLYIPAHLNMLQNQMIEADWNGEKKLYKRLKSLVAHYQDKLDRGKEWECLF